MIVVFDFLKCLVDIKKQSLLNMDFLYQKMGSVKTSSKTRANRGFYPIE